MSWLVSACDPEEVVVADDLPREILQQLVDAHRVTLCAPERIVARIEGELVATAGPERRDPAAGPSLGAPEVPGASTRATTSRARGPLVSFLIAFHDSRAFAAAALDSCIAQTFEDWEVIAVDDGSSDGTAGILDDYAARDPRIRVVHQRNVGGSGRMDLVWNAAARRARGDYLAFLGGDDVNEPSRLIEQLEAFVRDPRLDVVHTAALTIDSSGAVVGQEFHLPVGYDEASLLRDLTPVCLIGHPSVTVRRTTFEALGGMEDGLTCDYQFWLKAAGRARFRFLPQRLVRYRRHDTSLSTTSAGRDRTWRDGHRARRNELSRRDLLDFFPEIAERGSPVLRSDAFIHLGNAVVGEDLVLARHFYERAVGEHVSEAGVVNLAITLAALGETSGARALVGRHEPAGTALSAAIGNGSWAQLELRRPSAALDEAVTAWRSMSSGIASWDGVPAATNSLYLDLAEPEGPAARTVVAAWRRHTRAESPVRWVLPTLGRSEQETFERFTAAARGIDLDDAGDVVIEKIDDLSLMPVRSGSARGVLLNEAEARAVAGWIQESGRVERRGGGVSALQHL
ncbi:glycosyltransferase family 2 protein [Quadrisphaera oryzae]|uniref:glycosyltransferase family 2 protein n=1 Tax=Quadrisphaera TaxID=317661 RepID=UPI001646F6B9|nr:glycosyltransferase family 2 protein [Quadrisphaera sp. RL12-1S]